MLKVFISGNVWDKMHDLEIYLIDELKLPEQAAYRRTAKMREFIRSFGGIVRYPICRFKEWCKLGYRCAVFEKSWIFAYEEFEGGIIVRDMKHTTILIE
jgi:hypothetical protein